MEDGTNSDVWIRNRDMHNLRNTDIHFAELRSNRMFTLRQLTEYKLERYMLIKNESDTLLLFFSQILDGTLCRAFKV